MCVCMCERERSTVTKYFTVTCKAHTTPEAYFSSDLQYFVAAWWTFKAKTVTCEQVFS